MKIAIVGSGIGGIASAYYLKKLGHEIHLFEASDYFGGHTHTHKIEVDKQELIIDSGFLVHNDRTYPNLLNFFSELGISSYPSEMTFSVNKADDNLEWSGDNLFTLFTQKRNLFRPRFYKMIKDILHFNKNAEKYLQEALKKSYSLGELLKKYNYSNEFRDWYMLPMGGCIWSTPVDEMLRFSAATFIRFCLNHGLLQISDRPQWKTIKGGCNTYTLKVIELLDEAHLNEPVLEIIPKHKGCSIRTPHREVEYDCIFIATHPPTTKKILNGLDQDIYSVLDNFQYQPNTAVIHTDKQVLPKRNAAWSAWNYKSITKDDGVNAVSVSYLINQLQPLPTKTPVIVTLNPVDEIDQNKIIKTLKYEHPLFDQKAISAQEKVMSIQGKNNIFLTGAWLRYGFHEDGIWSALKAIDAFKEKYHD